MSAGIESASFFLKKLLLACIAGIFLVLLVQEYNGLRALAIVTLVGISLLFLGGILIFLKKHIFTQAKVFTFQIGVGISAFFLLNGFFFGIWHLFHGGDIISVFLHTGFLLAQAAGMGVFFVLASACGLFLLRLMHGPLSEGPFSWVFSFGIGLAFFAFGTFVLAILQWVHIVPFVCMVAGFSLLVRKEIVEVWRKIFQKTLTLSFYKEDIPIWLIWMCVVSALEIAFISGRATVLVAGFDGFHQYLTFPTEYLRYGGFTTFFWHPSWGFPQLGEMIFLFSLVFFGITGPFLVNFFLLSIFIIGLFQVLQSEKESRMHHWLIACIASSPILLLLGSVVKIDLLFYFYCLLIFVLMKNVFLSDIKISLSDGRTRVLLGVLFGILLSFKYTAFFIIGALFLALFFVSQEKKVFLKNAIIVFTIAFLVFSPWLVKNWVVYKSPLYPVFQGQDQLFQETGKMCSQYFQQLATQDVILSHAGFVHQTGNMIMDNLRILIFSLVYPETQKSLLSPGMWVLLFLPIVLGALFRWKALDRESRFLLLFSVIFLSFWVFFLLGALWYLFPVFIVLLLFVAQQVSPNKWPSLLQWWITIVAYISVILSVSGSVTFLGMNTVLQFANGDIALKDAVTRVPNEVGPLGMYQYINTLLHEEDEAIRVYSFMNPRGYFIENSSKRFIFDYYGEKLQCLGNTDDEIKYSLEQLKVKYIMVTSERRFQCNTLDYPDVNGICRSLSRFEFFIKRENMQPVYSEEDAVLYKFY